ncbi:zinc ribbon domain-containing protein [bacterium]|nr:zinc ribbon domain-containing protein [bacterium]
MPTYEYECPSCGARFERFQGMNEEPLGACPECGGSVKRMIGAGMGFLFKGSGFHATDYRSDRDSGKTCCGRSERCERPPCSDDGTCKR